MKTKLLFILMIVWPLVIYAATINAGTSGNWTDTGTWTGGVVPSAGDDVTASANKDITVESTDDITVKTFSPAANGSLTVDAGGQITFDNTGLIGVDLAANYDFFIDGTMIINGDLDVGSTLNLVVTGNLIINGNVTLSNAATINVSGGGTITINGDFAGGANTNITVDGTIDVSGDVTVGNGSSLSGTGTFSSPGTCSDGTSGFCESSTFPIKLLFFKANNVGSQVRLEWATYEQLNFDYFCIERSEDGLVYNCIEEIQGIDNSDMIIAYSTFDKAPLPGRSYYRLKAVDLDQTFEYFNIVRVDRQAEDNFTLYPNPTDGKFTMRLNFVPGENLKYTVYDLRGMIYETEKLTSHQSEYQNTRDLAPGLYLVRLDDDSGFKETRKLLVR